MTCSGCGALSATRSRRCLRRSKGVVIEGLGIFTLNERGAPKFILNPTFARKYRVQDADAKRTLARSEKPRRPEAPPPTGVVPNGKLSLECHHHAHGRGYRARGHFKGDE